MKFRHLGNFLFILLLMNTSVFAQEEDLRSNVDYKVDKMQKELNLTDIQADSIRPIIKDYLTKREAILKQAAEDGIVDHTAVNSTLKGLKDGEYQKLSKVLSQDQMQKWINKEVLRASLNPDSGESATDDDTTLTPEGANFKF